MRYPRALAFITIASCASAPEPPAPAAQPPALVVWITVDQLRGDMVDHYRPLWTGGFRRLMTDGRVFTNATQDHGITSTAPGHASLSTGVHPSRHGIVSNAWYQARGDTWQLTSNVGDPSVTTVGAALAGVSPRNLMSSGLADWIVAADSASIIASVSGKDRGAILPAAHAKGQVYWFEPAGGGFVTSTYYRDSYPEWVTRFNNEVVPRYMADTVWSFSAPASAIGLSSADTAAHESDGIHTYFPHRFSDFHQTRDANALRVWMEQTPLADAATLDFAQAMVTEVALGRDGRVDLLAISLSQTDAVGHVYGPFSREQLDNLYRLDRRLGAFFEFLDRAVGRERYIVALSADHGVLTPPEDRRAMPGSRRLTAAERQALQEGVARARAGGDGDSPSRIVVELKRHAVVADAWTTEQLMQKTPADSFAVFVRRSLYPGRFAGAFSRQGVEIRLAPGLLGNERTGTTHGSPYWYDRHVPMIFMGPGIRAARVDARASTVDFAPTLAQMIGVKYPRDLDGRSLSLRYSDCHPGAQRRVLGCRGCHRSYAEHPEYPEHPSRLRRSRAAASLDSDTPPIRQAPCERRCARPAASRARNSARPSPALVPSP
jgi:predicted AlkP superfamily pyrophosphatase or phosphodiesterase